MVKICAQEEIVAFVRRSSSAFARGRSSFRGVSGQSGRWEARIGSFAGKKNVDSRCPFPLGYSPGFELCSRLLADDFLVVDILRYESIL